MIATRIAPLIHISMLVGNWYKNHWPRQNTLMNIDVCWLFQHKNTTHVLENFPHKENYAAQQRVTCMGINISISSSFSYNVTSQTEGTYQNTLSRPAGVSGVLEVYPREKG